jgi:hypothetical protein
MSDGSVRDDAKMEESEDDEVSFNPSTPAGHPVLLAADNTESKEERLLRELSELEAEERKDALDELALRVELKRKDRTERMARMEASRRSLAAPAPPTSVVSKEPSALVSDSSPPLLPRRLVSSPGRPRVESEATTARKQRVAQLASVSSVPVSAAAASIVIPPLSGHVSPTEPPFRRPIRVPVPKEFSGVDDEQNREVEAWVMKLEGYMNHERLPESDRLLVALQFLTGTNSTKWYTRKLEELKTAGKVATWAFIRDELICDYGQSNSVLAKEVEWKELRMGVKEAVGVKATWTVKQYTDLFVSLMRDCSDHDLNTKDILVIDRYVSGIQLGYPSLYTAMKGAEQILKYSTLAEAKEGAEYAEIALHTVRKSLASSRVSGRPAFPTSVSRSPAGVEVSNLYGELQDDAAATSTLGAGDEEQPGVSANVFTSRPSSDGRHHLTPAEKALLYEGKRCYRCYAVHPFGPGKPRCSKPVQKVAPVPLK